ncbi:unnamed protein product [Owenia fusiformis]|uniref:Uncharacterized protein n=1 Tax=Owenia fusiformis TaxID=6347 RepID=A0A8J1TBQ5_OWEFU|nr:unnamed protein product [Owenia fusiformis]
MTYINDALRGIFKEVVANKVKSCLLTQPILIVLHQKTESVVLYVRCIAEGEYDIALRCAPLDKVKTSLDITDPDIPVVVIKDDSHRIEPGGDVSCDLTSQQIQKAPDSVKTNSSSPRKRRRTTRSKKYDEFHTGSDEEDTDSKESKIRENTKPLTEPEDISCLAERTESSEANNQDIAHNSKDAAALQAKNQENEETEEGDNKKNQENITSPDNKKSSVKCRLCDTSKIFKSDPMLKLHVSRHHKQDSEYLEEIQTRITNEKESKMKYKKIKGGIPIQCEICREFFSHPKLLMVHMDEQHTDQKEEVDGYVKQLTNQHPKCETCDLYFKTQDDANEHLEWLHVSQPDPNSKLHCKFCLKVHSNIVELNDHINLMHNTETDTYPKVSKALENSLQIADQQVIDTKGFQCRLCSKYFLPMKPYKYGYINSEPIKRHIISEHKGHAKYQILIDELEKRCEKKNCREQNIACRICENKLTDYSRVFDHVTKMHPNDPLTPIYIKELKILRRVTCKVCEQEFACSDHLKVHMKEIHCTKEESLRLQATCPICSKTFRTSKILTCHLKRSHTAERVQCHLCGKDFACGNTLWQHINSIHYTQKKSKCNICGKLVTKNAYQKHLTTHTKEFRFHCEHCGKGFHESHNKQRHVTTIHDRHKLVKIPCQFCGKLFTSKSNLHQHTMSVHGQGLLQCKQCNKTFMFKSRLEKHEAEAHNTGTQPVNNTKQIAQPEENPAPDAIQATVYNIPSTTDTIGNTDTITINIDPTQLQEESQLGAIEAALEAMREKQDGASQVVVQQPTIDVPTGMVLPMENRQLFSQKYKVFQLSDDGTLQPIDPQDHSVQDQISQSTVIQQHIDQSPQQNHGIVGQQIRIHPQGYIQHHSLEGQPVIIQQPGGSLPQMYSNELVQANMEQGLQPEQQSNKWTIQN